MTLVSSAVLEAALESADNERKYTASKHAIHSLAKEEDARRLRTDILVLEGDIDELHEQLEHEQECSARFRGMVEEHLSRAQQAEAALEAIQLRESAQTHDVARLKTEIDSLRNSNQDATTVLAEKLALTRELTVLKPELEHLRAQAASVEQLVTETLALQRQLADARCEIESSRAEAKRAQAKRRNTTMEIAQEAQVEDLKKQLAREKRARASAEEVAEQAQGQMKIDDVRRELAKEKKLRERLEEELDAAKENTQVEQVRRDLLKTKKVVQRLEDQNADLQLQLERAQAATAAQLAGKSGNKETDTVIKELQHALASETAARQSAEKTYNKKEEQWDSDKTSLDDKLNQFRTKLKETKALLETTKEELTAATERASKAEHDAQLAATEAAIANIPAKKTTAKRTAKVVEPPADETTLGTPGDGPRAKRTRKVNAAIGSKSAFSITPFLNKTTVIDADEDMQDAEPEASPIAEKPRARRPLAHAASIKANSKLGTESKTPTGGKSVAVVQAEEESPTKEDQASCVPEAVESREEQDDMDAKQKQKAKAAKPKAAKDKQKPRKSLVDFETFQKGDDEPVVKQKKRKLGLRGPTLFDEEDDATVRPLFSTTPGNRLVPRSKAASVVKNSRSGLMTASDGSGFKFSPLRRNRKTLDDTLRG